MSEDFSLTAEDSRAFDAGWYAGECGLPLTDEMLKPYTGRRFRAFVVGYEGGREWYLDHIDVAPLRVSGV